MFVPRTLDGTTCTTAVAAARPLLALHPRSARRTFRPSAVTLPRLPLPLSSLPSSAACLPAPAPAPLPLPSPLPLPRVATSSACPDGMDALFIHALARAASCHKHQPCLPPVVPLAAVHHRPRRKSCPHSVRRAFLSTRAAGALKRARSFAERELRALVDYYGITLDPGPASDVPDDGLLIWNVGDDHQPWPVQEEGHTAHIAELEELLQDELSPHGALFDCYKRLPAPGVAYLRTETIRALLHHLAIVERADHASMQRFLSILDDMKTACIHITRSEWTSAIRFAGRFMGKVSADEVQSALYMWRDMEKRAGVKAGPVTLNVLFDVAVKGGKYSLAESFLKEMQLRKLKIHRHFRVSLLYYYGVLQDGNAVRRTYQDLVAAGDVVDTAVLNAVIASLIRAGEPAAAEHVFERMKRLHATRTHRRPGPRDWRERRLLGLHLTYQGRKLAESGELEKRKEFQDLAPIGPDSRTYGLIVRHHAATVGNIDRVQELLREMLHSQIPLDGTLFIVILYGFSSFGGVRYSSWTRGKLEPIWAEYLKSVRDGVQRTWFSPMSVIVALKAFKKCTDDERTLQAWQEVRLVWKPTPSELEQVLSALRRLVPEYSFSMEPM